MASHNILTVILILQATVLSASKTLGQPPSLLIEVLNIEKNRGKVVIEIYNEKSEWLKKPFRRLTLATSDNAQTASFAVPEGKYAVSVYQDINENNQLDMNFLRIPKEPIGFGNNYKPFGQPKFESSVIDFTSSSKPAVIKLFTVF